MAMLMRYASICLDSTTIIVAPAPTERSEAYHNNNNNLPVYQRKYLSYYLDICPTLLDKVNANGRIQLSVAVCDQLIFNKC